MQKSKVAEQADIKKELEFSLATDLLMTTNLLRRSHRNTSKLFVILAITLLTLFATVTPASGQLTGTKNIPGDYPTLEAAISDLNLLGVGAGGVTLNLLPGNPQTAPVGGYVIGGSGSLVLSTSSMANPVILQGNSNTITAAAPQNSGSLTDALIKLIGADWVTVDGFTLTESATNTNTTSTNDMTEWGIALLYATTTDGTLHNKIQNNTIDLNRDYVNTFGIYANVTHSATAPDNGVTATTPAGSNSGLKIYANSITDCNVGIVVVGPTAASDHTDGIEIGGPGMGNSITNFGTGLFSGYVNTSNTVNGVVIRNVKNYAISNNTVTSSEGGTTTGILRGIYVFSFSNAPTGTITNNINNNIISLKSGASSAMHGISVEANTGNATTTLNINANDFNNTTHTVTSPGVITFISNGAVVLNNSISNNTFTNLSVNTSGIVTCISNNWSLPANGVKQVSNNQIIAGFTKTVAGGSFIFFTDSGTDPATAANNVTNNVVSNISVTGATVVTGIASFNTGLSAKSVSNNQVSNISGGTGAIIGIHVDGDNGTTTVSGNTISNLSGGSSVTGISLGAAGAGTTNGNQNLIHSFTSTGTGTCNGILVNGPSSTRNIFRNKIYNLQNTSTTGLVNGIQVQSSLSVNLFNNLIGDLKTPSASGSNPINGININSILANSTVNVSFNTIYLNASSTASTFGSSGVFHAANATPTTATLNLRNNIIVNLSTPKGAGYTTAFRRSNTALENYGSLSNNNLLYAGTPGLSRVILMNGTTPYQTLSDFKTLVAPRDANSVTENPPFLSTSGTNVNFLHIDPAIPTQVESGASPIAGITDDFDGNTRNATTPDIGADEGEFMVQQASCMGAEGGTAIGSVTFCGSGIPNISASGYSEGVGSTYQWQSSTDPAFTNPLDIPGQTNPAMLNTGTVTMTTYYRLKVTCTSGNTLDYSNIIEVAVNTLIVENIADNGHGSLRDVIACAPAGSTITFASALNGQAILLTSGEIDINKNLTISGLGPANLTISGNNNSRIFHVLSGFDLKVKNISLINGSSVSEGGAILTQGDLILENVTLNNNFENGTAKALTIQPPGTLEIIGQVNMND